MKKTNIKITRYEYKNFFVDIVKEDGELSAWLQHKDYGISELMYGINDNLTVEEFEDMVTYDVTEYIADYVEKYCDDKTCSICGGKLDEIDGNYFGNNPEPITDKGRCCNHCNETVVIPARLKQLLG